MKSFLWRHKSLLVIWLLVFALGGYITYTVFAVSNTGNENPYKIGSASHQNQPSSQVESSQKTQATPAKIGQAVKDGDLEFTVTGTKCNGERTIGPPYAQAQAQGQFCRLSITVKNLGSQPISLPLAAQKALVNDETPRRVDESATQYAQANQAQGYWYEQIAAGKSVSGDLVFDVNDNDKLIQADLHATDGSPGLKVAL